MLAQARRALRESDGDFDVLPGVAQANILSPVGAVSMRCADGGGIFGKKISSGHLTGVTSCVIIAKYANKLHTPGPLMRARDGRVFFDN